MPSRVLVSLIRVVPSTGREAYERRWAQLQRLTTELGANAWRFASASEANRHIEFLEFPAESDPRADGSVARILEELSSEIGPAVSEEWIEL